MGRIGDPEADIGGVAVFLASEDARFYFHRGFDWEGICTALRKNERGGKLRGGSTISQQVARNVFLWQGRSYLRKGLEAWYTLWLELLLLSVSAVVFAAASTNQHRLDSFFCFFNLPGGPDSSGPLFTWLSIVINSFFCPLLRCCGHGAVYRIRLDGGIGCLAAQAFGYGLASIRSQCHH
jgi:hypothetical protein